MATNRSDLVSNIPSGISRYRRRDVLQAVGVLSLTLILFTLVAFAQPPESTENRLLERVFLAKDDGSGNPGKAMMEFEVTDTPIHCVVVLANADTVTVRMDLVVVDVPGIRSETKIVSTSYTTKDMQDRVLFHGKPRGRWLAGAYRADIYIEGILVGKFPFSVKAAARTAVNGQPRSPVQMGRHRATALRWS